MSISKKMFNEAHLTLTGYSESDLRAISYDDACRSDDNLYNTLYECQGGKIQQLGFCVGGCSVNQLNPGLDICNSFGSHKNENENRVNIQIEI